jgi:hypothetical protein
LLGERRCSGRVGSSKIRYIFFFFNSNVCVIDGHEYYVPSCCSHYQSLFMINHRIVSWTTWWVPFRGVSLCSILSSALWTIVSFFFFWPIYYHFTT